MSDPLYDACLALKGGTTWWTTDQIAEGLRARGADFIIKKEQYNDTGVCTRSRSATS